MSHIVPKPPPGQRVPIVDEGRQITPPWFYWLKQLNDDVIAKILSHEDELLIYHHGAAILAAFAASDP